MRIILLLLGLIVAGCAVRTETIGAPRSEVLRDVEGYAIASCLLNQTDPYLKDQGDAWASVIVQRMKGNFDDLAGIREEVKREIAKGRMAIIRNETGPEKDKAVPLLYCNEIIDRPKIRTAIQSAVAVLKPSYEK
jgi:hypothetical protein